MTPRALADRVRELLADNRRLRKENKHLREALDRAADELAQRRLVERLQRYPPGGAPDDLHPSDYSPP